MRSIRSKFAILSIVCILLCTAVTAGFGLWSLARIQEQSTDEILSLTCLQQSTTFNQTLLNIEGSVDACGELAVSRLSEEGVFKDESLFSRRMAEMESLVGSIAQNTPGVCTYYLRVAYADGLEPAGFFYTRKTLDAPLTSEPLTPILQYEPNDLEHVGWYYLPSAAREPLWMEPYYNQNIDVYMVSYVVPLYVDGVFRGVMGMDVDFRVIVNVARRIQNYETGNAFLVSPQGLIHYHPGIEAGAHVTDYTPELAPIVEELPSLPEGEARSYTYSLYGVQKKLACCSLRNGMVLMLTVDRAEINEPVTVLLRLAVAVAAVLSAVMLAVALIVSGRIVRPLTKLTEAANQIAQGDLDVELPEATDDEVGVLTRTLDVTVRSLREYISGINAKAYRDTLTHVKNKTAYDEAVDALEAQMRAGEVEFGLGMFDANFLKEMNDQYGHDRGDDYLRACCQLICRVFHHSPVYRIGGDEFVVLLQRDDYRDREALLEQFNREMAQSQELPEPWLRISVAKGIALCEPGDVEVEAVFRRADQAMYEDKRRMKAGR